MIIAEMIDVYIEVKDIAGKSNVGDIKENLQKALGDLAGCKNSII